MSSVKRHLKNFSKNSLRKGFELGQRLGVDVLPRHFYSEIPDIRKLKTSTEWRTPYTMIGVNGSSPEGQMEFVAEICSADVVTQMQANSILDRAAAMNGDMGYGPIEADFLFAFVATRKPRQIVQIGCGVSTAVCLLAAEYAGYKPDIVCIEPWPTKFLLAEAATGRIRLIKEHVQCLDIGFMEELSDDTFFFVDSSHTLGPAGEVSRIILEMLPRLKPGATVHFHDIRFPYDYDPTILDTTIFFWHESILLHAFLAGNDSFRILASFSMLNHACAEQLPEFLPNYSPASLADGLKTSEGHFPSSTYLEVV